MIIGVTGTYGSGKGTVVDYLVQNLNFKHYSASGFIAEEVKRRGLTHNRDTLIAVANELRKEYGPTYIIDSLYRRAQEAGGDAVIESLRALAEVRRIKALGGTVVGVDADQKLRYERARKRGSEKDNVSYEKFIAQEQSEANPDDPTKQNLPAALAESDVLLTNDGTPEELRAQIERFLLLVKK